MSRAKLNLRGLASRPSVSDVVGELEPHFLVVFSVIFQLYGLVIYLECNRNENVVLLEWGYSDAH